MVGHYKLGGTDRSGIDCSAYSAQLHREVAGHNLPRTTREQWAAAQPLGIANLTPGDLVFFATEKRGAISHVGVLLGERSFTHAGSGTGVTVSSLDDPYWNERYLGARRFQP
jgi:murein DD-endopeptidase / murein LD-carboxypeptidase